MLIIWALASIGGAQAVHAQETASWGDVGISVSPLFREYLDVPVCCTPPGGWVTWGTGKYRLQVDYVRNRRQYRTSGGYYEIREGREVVVERGGVGINVAQVAVASLYWRIRETSRYSLHVLLGVGYWNRGERSCVAAGEPVNRLPPRPHDPDELWFRVDLTDEEEQRCRENPPYYSPSSFFPQVGAGVDVPIGSRFFARLETESSPFLVETLRDS